MNYMGYMGPQEPPHWAPPPAEAAPFQWIPYVFAFMRRRWPTMAIGVVCAVALALAYAFTATPRFTAETDLLFDINGANVLRQQTTANDPLTLNSMLESQVEVLQSVGLARKAVVRLKLDGEQKLAFARPSPIDWVRGVLTSLHPDSVLRAGADDKESKIDGIARQLMGMVKVRRVGQTYVLGISVTSASPEEAARLANGMAETYLADQMQAKEEGIQQATGWLQARITELHDQALVADRAVQDYKARHEIVDTDRGLMGNQQLTELSTQLVTARANTASMLARLQRIEVIMLQGVDGGGTVTDGLDNRVIVTLRQQYVDDDRRATDLAAKFGKDHAVVRDLRNEMAEIKKSIQGELGRIAETYKSDYQVAAANETAVQGRLDQMVAKAAQTNNDLVLLRSLQSSADTYRSLYQNFLQRYTQAVQDQSFPVPEARVITRALPPLRKSEPRTTIIAVFGAVLGGILGFTVAFVRQALDRSIRTPGQLRAVTGMHCLGVVPRLRSRKMGRVWPRLAPRPVRVDASAFAAAPGSIMRQVLDAPKSAYSSAIRDLRMRIVSKTMRSREMKVIGCLASSREAGASTIAAGLAQLLAQTAGRTILVDWDFADPSLSLNLTGKAGPGWLDVLEGKVLLGAAVRHDPQTGLSFLSAGRFDGSSFSTPLVKSEQMHELLADLRAQYSYVVVDLPPLSAVADAHMSAHLLDAIVIVTEWGREEKDRLVDKLARIGLEDANILGAVLNKANLKAVRNDAPPVRTYEDVTVTS